MKFIEISSLNDDLLLPWLDIYETSFKPDEKVLVSTFLKNLKEKDNDTEMESYMVSLVKPRKKLLAIANYEQFLKHNAAFLWYIAVIPEEQNKKYGTLFYKEIIKRLNPSIKALFYEVEIPNPEENEQYNQSKRRINFYRALGAKIIKGIEYIQSIGSHQKPKQMLLMVDCLTELNPLEIFNMAKPISGKWLKKKNKLFLL